MVRPFTESQYFRHGCKDRRFQDARMSPELMTIERVAVLKRVALFSEVPGHTLVAVARRLEEVSFQVGDSIMDRGAVEDWLFVVAAGRIRVHIGELTLLENGPGAVVG